jgi:hypothetical protein
MKIALALLAALGLTACMGPEGNPNRQPYADQGMIAVTPQPAPAVAYDPYAAKPGFSDLDIGQPALNPTPSPPPLYQPPPR